MRFGLVGLSNTAVNFICYYILRYLLGNKILFGDKNYLFANTISFIISVLNAYFWSSRFVFHGHNNSKTSGLLRVYISYGSTFLLSIGLVYVLVEIAHIGRIFLFLQGLPFVGGVFAGTEKDVGEIIAPLLLLFITIPLNFMLNKFWVFKKAKTADDNGEG